MPRHRHLFLVTEKKESSPLKMEEWTLLDDSYSALTAAKAAAKELPRASPELLKQKLQDKVAFGYPRRNTVHTSMLFIKQWLATAGVKIYHRGLEKLQKVPGRRNIITPNHPNLFDSIATRYLFYLGGQFVPFTAAVDTLRNVPVFAPLLKDNGAFFIDTKRFGDLEYRQKVNSFMQTVTDEGEWLQFYFEGDRHAHERQRVPRHGLLKAMTDRPCAFFPVSIGYEKIITSHLSGIGRIFIEVHDPILTETKSNFPGFVSSLAATVQRGVPVFTTDVVATLLARRASGSTLSLSDLQEEVDWFAPMLRSRDLTYVEVSLATTLSFLGVKVKKNTLRVPDDQTRLLSHRERILHTFYDLAAPPPQLTSEFAWTPAPPLIDGAEYSELARQALTPLVSLYSALITALDSGITKVKEVEAAALNPQITLQTVRNTLRLLQTQGVIKIDGGEITLL